MSVLLFAPPAVEPLTSTEAKARLNIGDEVSDQVMAAFITAARQMIDGIDGWLGRALVTQTWDLVLDGFPGCGFNPDLPASKGFYPIDYGAAAMRRQHRLNNAIVLPLPPTQVIVSITYTDTQDAPQTVDPSTYVLLKGEPSHVVLADGATWPSAANVPGSVKVRFIAGYGDAGSNVPETIRMAIALQVSHLRSLSQQNLFLRSQIEPGVFEQQWALSSNAGDVIDAAAQSLLNQYRVWT